MPWTTEIGEMDNHGHCHYEGYTKLSFDFIKKNWIVEILWSILH